MSSDSITTFLTKASTDPALAAKIEAIHTRVQGELAETLAALSIEAGTPFTAEEYLHECSSTLSDAELEQVAGGAFFENVTNAVKRIFTTPNLVGSLIKDK